MNKNDLFRAFDGVDDDILARSEAPAARRRAPAVRRWWGALAACVALATSLVGGVIAAEAKEYSAAVEFFDANGLSTEGLSREDVKAVYRDITTQRFTYEKTVEVIERAVPGVEISQKEPTPEELAALWNYSLWNFNSTGEGINYRWHYQCRHQPGVPLFLRRLRYAPAPGGHGGNYAVL